MKKLFLFVALFTWIGFSASAQVMKDSTKKEMRKESKEMKKESKMDHRMTHHWIVRDGKVMEVKDGKEHHMTTETEVGGGVWIRPNGEVVMKDNKVVHLRSDQYLDTKGKIHTMMKAKK
jgi:hypothetical protein